MDILQATRFAHPIAVVRFDPWQAEIATMTHAATNIAGLVDAIGAALLAALRAISQGIEALRRACPIDGQPKLIAPVANDSANDSTIVPSHRVAA